MSPRARCRATKEPVTFAKDLTGMDFILIVSVIKEINFAGLASDAIIFLRARSIKETQTTYECRRHPLALLGIWNETGLQ